MFITISRRSRRTAARVAIAGVFAAIPLAAVAVPATAAPSDTIATVGVPLEVPAVSDDVPVAQEVRHPHHPPRHMPCTISFGC
ncbi:hypothetical protein OG563_06965 [Nocardia vinacea]|uniref:Secreted protein n=1 Tax=Nocardia vinacea TaxID=96468 RepID=A0ABZ1Z0F1_9NOCA|nr:hypothetical protein [Nocardia vinacea]